MARDIDLNFAYHSRSIHRPTQRGSEVWSPGCVLHVALCFLVRIVGFGPIFGEVEDGRDEVRDEDLAQQEGGVVDFGGGGGVVHGAVGGGGVRGGGLGLGCGVAEPGW